MNLAQRKKDYFALAFSDRKIQVAESSRKGRLRYYAEKKLPSGVIERGQIKKKNSLRQAVISLLKSVKLKNKFVVVGLPEIRSFTRTFALPNLSIEELNDAARWESEPLLPFPLKKAYLDWMILEKGEAETRILVVALPKDLVEDYALVLESLKLQPIAFEITSLSLARLIKKNSTATLIISVQKEEAVLVIVGAKGGIEVSSTVSFSNEAESTAEIVSTLKNVLAFYRKKVGEAQTAKKVARILFCGEAANESLAKKAQAEVNIPASVLKGVKPGLACMTSLARKNVAAPIDEKTINLIPPRIQGVYDRASRIREVSGWLKLSLASLFLILFGYSVTWAHLYFEEKRIERRNIELLSAISPEVKEMEKKAVSINTRAQKIVSLADSQSAILSLFSLLRQKAPEGVDLNQINFEEEKGSILVSGLALSRKDLLAYKETLEKTDEFFRVQVPLSSLEKEENVRFTILVSLAKE